ncbi:MAG: V-type ATPase subunit, partial [Streptococcaceae bacterium]|nr:V-type ATPase subunit [Streptococcaceae bacterium]
MEDIQYSQVNILVRIREGELLTNEEFQKYIQFNSLDELRESLRTTHYGKYAAKDDFFDSIDKYLMKDRAETFRELYSVSPDKEILYFFTRRFTFHNIKIAIKSKFTGRDFSHLAIPDGVYPYAEITQAVLGNYSAALPSVYEEAIQLANDYLDKEGKHYGV